VFKKFLFYWSSGIFIMVNAVSNYSHVHITTLAKMYTYSKHCTYQNTKSHLPASKRSAANSWTFCCNDCFGKSRGHRETLYTTTLTQIYKFHSQYSFDTRFTCFYFTFVNKPYRIFFFSLMMPWIF